MLPAASLNLTAINVVEMRLGARVRRASDVLGVIRNGISLVCVGRATFSGVQWHPIFGLAEMSSTKPVEGRKRSRGLPGRNFTAAHVNSVSEAKPGSFPHPNEFFWHATVIGTRSALTVKL